MFPVAKQCHPEDCLTGVLRPAHLAQFHLSPPHSQGRQGDILSGRCELQHAHWYCTDECVKTAEFTFLEMSASLVRTIPPRGPRSVLCVVVVATWQ